MKRAFLVIVFMLVCMVNTMPVGASANDFEIDDFAVEYYLGIDEEGRSILKTIEHVTAIFPNFDQNHGLERAIPKSFDGHSVNLSIISIKDKEGVDYQYTTYRSNDNLVLRIGDADKYVRGRNEYFVTYTQRDVTKFYEDTDKDEFYWNVNGTEWSQQFNSLSAKVYIDSSLTPLMTGDLSCYYGFFGSTAQCNIVENDGLIIASVDNLEAGENMSIAVGFKPNTFSDYKKTMFDYFSEIVGLIAVIFSVSGLMYLLHLTKNDKGVLRTRAIIPRYLPPKDMGILASSMLFSIDKWEAAAFIDLAVRKKIKIIEQKGTTWFSKNTYKLRLENLSNLKNGDKMLLDGIFDHSSSIGASCTIQSNKPNLRLASAMMRVRKETGLKLKSDKYFISNEATVAKMIIAVILLFMFMFFTIFFIIFNNSLGFVNIIGSVVSFFVTASSLMVVAFHKKPYTKKGREARSYLEGLKMYIGVAEKDRLKFLQSPDGAEKITIDVNDKERVVDLYEKLLPYAVLFGQEKEWIKKLGIIYAEQSIQPDWFSGSNGFDAVMFASAMSNFSISVSNNSYSSSASSASGGSGGGGFSGGGGGGGGGGGW